MDTTIATIDIEPGKSGLLIPWKGLAGAVLLIFAIAGSYFSLKTSQDAATTRIAQDEAAIQDMQKNGHPDHERRITALEAQKADRLAAIVEEQSHQIDSIAAAVAKTADAQRADHDVLLRLATLMESRAKSETQ